MFLGRYERLLCYIMGREYVEINFCELPSRLSHPVHNAYLMHLRNYFSFLLYSLLTLYGTIETD